MAKKRVSPDFSFQAAASGASNAGPSGARASAEKQSYSLDLTNHFLIAMPSIVDPVFGGTVVYMCEHNAAGALGVVINKPTDMTIDTLLERIELKPEALPQLPQPARQVMFGGPVQGERGFVLHSPGPDYSSTLRVTSDVALTTSKDVLEAVAAGNGPDNMLVSLGCSGWSAGQLEQEIARNSWLTVEADSQIIFSLPVQQRFTAAVRLLGIDPVMLTAESGRA